MDLVHADALAVPEEDGAFGAVRSQHASMNVPDKEALYAEARRVLRGDVHLLLGGDYGAMFANRVRNLEEERIRILMGVWRRP